MKTILFLALFVLAGCSSIATMEELEAEALATGDWSAVEKRERGIERRNSRAGLSCPSGTTGYCESAFGHEECMCVESAVLSAFYSR